MAQEVQEGDKGAVAKRCLSARASLEHGLAASASHEPPIAGKFDRKTGRVLTAENITESEGLNAPTAHSAAMARARVPLGTPIGMRTGSLGHTPASRGRRAKAAITTVSR